VSQSTNIMPWPSTAFLFFRGVFVRNLWISREGEEKPQQQNHLASHEKVSKFGKAGGEDTHFYFPPQKNLSFRVW